MMEKLNDFIWNVTVYISAIILPFMITLPVVFTWSYMR